MNENEKNENFERSSKKIKNIIACFKCGSTYIEHLSPNYVNCCHCGNFTIWDQTKFLLIEDGDSADFCEKHCEALNYDSAIDRTNNWDVVSIRNILDFGHRLADTPKDFQFDTDVNSTGFKTNMELKEGWEDLKAQIDSILYPIPLE